MNKNNIPEDMRRMRVSMGEKSLKAFAQIYFPLYLSKKSCSFHEDLYKMLDVITKERGERIAIASPRGSAKSSIVSLIYPLWCICYKKENYILLVSDTADQAANLLEHIKDELTMNERLQEDFPNICESGQKPKPPRWTREEIVTRNGIKVTALGVGQKVRGRRKKQIRPSLVILDDIENDENTQSDESRQKLFNWFSKAVLKAGETTTNVIVIGTIQHYDSLLAKLTSEDDMPGWQKRIYKSVISWANRQDLWQKWAAIFNGRDHYLGKTRKEAAYNFFLDHKQDMLEGTQVLWEDREDYYALMVMREQELTSSFDSEKQNEPVRSQDSLFNPAEFRYWPDIYRSKEELLQYLGENAQFFGSCDPSGGESTSKGDYSAIVVLARDRRDGTLYIIEADIKRRTPNDTMNDILAYCLRYKFYKFGVESNYFQDLMVRELGNRGKVYGLYPPIEPIKNTANKIERIQSLHPLVKNGTILFNKAHQMLIDQGRYFPKGKYDDGLDALEMAVRLCVGVENNFMFWFAGRTRDPRTGEVLTHEEELKRDAIMLAPDSLVPYGWWGWNRRG